MPYLVKTLCLIPFSSTTNAIDSIVHTLIPLICYQAHTVYTFVPLIHFRVRFVTW